jgi:hypothetical protein
MATRRYHKKRVSRKGRKVGKGRKSRRVRRIRGGKLIKDMKPFKFEEDKDINEQFASLNGVIRTKTSKLISSITKKLYSIEISGNKMIWHPLAFNTSQNLARGSIFLQNTFNSVKNVVTGNTSDAEEYPAALFVKNLKQIYSNLNIDNGFDQLSKAPLGDVTLEHNKITIKDNNTFSTNSEKVYNVTGDNNSEDVFKTNVVNFYKTGDVVTD